MRWVMVLGLAGCFFDQPHASIRDGEACKSNMACASGFCQYGYCRGSDCSHDACQANWQCVLHEGGIFTYPSSTCEPLCGYCPLNYSCAPGKTGTCSDEPAPLSIVITASKQRATTGETVSFSVTASSPRGDITSYQWSFYDGNPPITGLTASHAWTRPGAQVARVDVTDATGVTNNAGSQVLVCGTLGTRCEFHDDCCSGDCDVFGTRTCLAAP